MPVGEAFGGLLLTVLVSTGVWAMSLALRDASIADIAWGPGFVVLAWFYPAAAGSFSARSLLMALLVTLWGGRLAVHILRRHHGEDSRYRKMRDARGEAFWWQSLFIVFWLQAALLWIVAMPLLAAAHGGAARRIGALDVIGTLLVVAGFVCETAADAQLARFKASNAGRARVLDTGLWRYSRHPNYFGDALLWWGLYVIGAAAWPWATLLSPALMTFLLTRVSGVALLEQNMIARPGYAEYVARTSAFVPWRPQRTQS